MPGAGQLNSLIHIQKPFDTTDADTGEEITAYKNYHQKVPAKREDTSGGSTRRGQQVEETVRTVFTIPFIEDVEPSWRVRLINKNNTGPDFEIVSILDRDDRRTWLELHCSDIK